MKTNIAFASLLLLWFLQCSSLPQSNYSFYEPCLNSSSLQYSSWGQFSISNSFISCIKNAVDPLLYPGYASQETLFVQTQVALNNLIEIDELHSLITVDMFFRVYWIDPRLHMPTFWEQINETVVANGIDVSQLLGPVQTLEGYQVGIWLPDIIFPDAQELVVTDWFLKLFPGGKLDWSRHMIVTLLQSQFNYQQFPSDTLSMVFRFNSNSLGVKQFTFYPKDPGVVLYLSYDNSLSFTLNPVWSFDTMTNYITVEDNGTPGSPRYRSVGIVEATITRTAQGMQLRLAIPIFLLAFLAALAFWADPTDRMNTTITVLLAVSALYIIVFENIPMIGYLTQFDLYVVVMFFILFGCCILHQLIVRMTRLGKKEKWPMRNFYVRFLELIGRLTVIPLVSAMFLYMFYKSLPSENTVLVLCLSIGLFAVVVGSREYFAVESALRKAMHEIATKVEHLDNLSAFEIALFNYYTYHEVSTSLRRHIVELRRRQQALEVENQRADVDLADKHLTSFNSVEMNMFTADKASTKSI